MKTETYQRLGQELLKEWDNVLILNLEPNFSDLKTDEVEFIQKANKKDFWSDLITQKHRNTFQLNKEKYYKILKGKNNLHTQIKGQIIDKLVSLSKCAYFPQPTPINIEKDQNGKPHLKEINGQFAHFNKCLVTGLDISMQRKDAITLSETGLKYYKENAPEIYKNLENKYLKKDQKNKNLQEQFYYLAHNIRNAKYNPQNNRKRFECRNYHKQQLQFNF